MVSSDSSGFILGNYQLIEILGVGAMSYVYRARQLNLDRDVAVKILAPSLSQETGYLELFIREARTAAALEHPHIVPVIDYGVQQNVSYVAMRLLSGGSLGDRIEDRLERNLPLPSLSEIAHILTQAASALDYAHGRGVIHRDIKPNNLVFDQHGAVYIVDFGIAKLMGTTSSIKGSTFLGTPSFMAPEQWQGLSPTPAVDQYALGAVVYMMITGHPPFEAEIALALMRKHLNEMPANVQQYRPNTPAQVNAILQKAMAKQPEDRFPSTLAFAREFAAAVRDVGDEPATEFATFHLPLATYQLPFPTALSAPLSTVNVAPTTENAPAPTPSPARGQKTLLWILSTLVVLLAVALIVLMITQLGNRGAPITPTAIAGFAVVPTQSASLAADISQPSATDGNNSLLRSQRLLTATALEMHAVLASMLRATIDSPIDPTSLTNTPASTQTDTVADTLTLTPSLIASSTATVTPSNTLSATPNPTATLTLSPSDTPTVISSPKATTLSGLTWANTPALRVSATPAATRTFTPTATDTPTVTASATQLTALRPTVNWRAGTPLKINNRSGVWLRSRPTTRGSQVATLAYNNSVTSTGNYSFDGRQWWWEVRATWGAVGWVEQYSLVQN